MLHRFDTDQRIENVGQFDEILSLCCQAKNALSKHHGYSPEQFVLGKATDLPGSLTSDESTVAHSLALGSDLESERFRTLLEDEPELAKPSFFQTMQKPFEERP